jgi:phosphatidylglycerol:prolipoprotein diacylglycerol transferase
MNQLPLINPIALSIGSLEIRWYGIILGLAALFGLLLAIREGKRFNIKPDFFMDLLLIGVPSAIIAARIYYVAFEWETYKGNFYEMIAIWHGGIAIHGALIGAIIGAVIYTRVKKVNFWRIADIAAPSLIAGQMVGRWGNFVNQEAHGGPVDPAFLTDTLHLPNWIVNHMYIQEVYYHPTFLYESMWNLAGLLFLIWLRRRPFLRSGELFMSYFIWYSIGRFYIEGVRTDSLAFEGPDWFASFIDALWAPMTLTFEAGSLPVGGGNIRSAQVISLLIIVAAILIIIWRRKSGNSPVKYSDPVLFGTPGNTITDEVKSDEDRKAHGSRAKEIHDAGRKADSRISSNTSNTISNKTNNDGEKRTQVDTDTPSILQPAASTDKHKQQASDGQADQVEQAEQTETKKTSSSERIVPRNPFL